MLSNLSIKNYALIDFLNVSFSDGFTIITGETGAGKSILLGGLSLVLGKRADLSALRDKDKKCIIEAEFEIKKYKLKSFFKGNDLDYEDTTIVRREILPSGKSRAFINDTPITLDILSQLGNQLIDVHSQHQTLQLGDIDYQMKVIDALADNTSTLHNYSEKLEHYKNTSKELGQLVDFQNNADKEYEYNSFLLKELEEASLKVGMQQELEKQYEQLNNVEAITEQLSISGQLMNGEQIGILSMLSELKQASNKLSEFGSQYSDLNERIQSVFIELNDIAGEIYSLQEQTEANPQLLEELSGKLQLLFNLQKKHSALDIAELLKVKEELTESVGATENIESNIDRLQEELLESEKDLKTVAETLTKRRLSVLSNLKQQLEDSLALLGMPSAEFQIEMHLSSEFKSNGCDNLTFLFSANKGSGFGELKKVASGGELSRIMLTIKAILAKYDHLPTMMFDEIDTGVSGEISNKMGDIMAAMSKNMQVFSITHLPQVASKGNEHFKVYKTEEGKTTNTKMKKLSQDERVVELAEMLGGADLSDSAIAHARQLLN
ncbi:DNA repair protein RecN [Maribacter algarum]|uniref:DNA repair protein RecN n=1 Tax=Maribacter algarum (ex Zhang et al. 2020) TaxID=2578118 RepID=A0A5S3PQK5_9FLAO|nr:DNA repair protein RecN [Maribacter algarum]TMM56909.1 DNA repair protein RecN [Maribacter algarum]